MVENKKGFTLVELLAVIAILAILVIIALPNVMGMFNSAKKSTFVTEAEKIYQQVTTDFVSDNLKKSGERTYCQIDGTKNVEKATTTGVTCDEASNTDSLNKKLNLNTTKNYYIEVASDGSVGKFIVYDNSFVVAYPTGVTKVTDIKETNVKDISKVDNFTVTNASVTETSTNQG